MCIQNCGAQGPGTGQMAPKKRESRSEKPARHRELLKRSPIAADQRRNAKKIPGSRLPRRAPAALQAPPRRRPAVPQAPPRGSPGARQAEPSCPPAASQLHPSCIPAGPQLDPSTVVCHTRQLQELWGTKKVTLLEPLTMGLDSPGRAWGMWRQLVPALGGKLLTFGGKC